MNWLVFLGGVALMTAGLMFGYLSWAIIDQSTLAMPLRMLGSAMAMAMSLGCLAAGIVLTWDQD